MNGYDGYSKSNNALAAEEKGLLPLSRAVPEVARCAKCTRKLAREALTAIEWREWHHTSKNYNKTYYYCVAEAVRWIEARPAVAKLEELGYVWRLDLAIDSGRRDDEVARLAGEAGSDEWTVLAAYYNCWEP